jgi:hypothetical protein
MKRAAFLWMTTLGLVALTTVAVLGGGGVPTRGSPFTPDGYIRIVRDVFVREGYLHLGGDDDRVVVLASDFEERAGRGAKAFYLWSSLRRDLALDDPTLWRIDDSLIGLAPTSVSTPSPFAAGGWRGDFTRRGGLAGLSVSIDEREVARMEIEPIPSDGEPVPQDLDVTSRDASIVTGSVLRLRRGDEAGAPLLAELAMFGTKAVLQIEQSEVLVDAVAVRAKPGDRIRVYPSTEITLKPRGGGRAVVVSLRGDASAFARPQALGGRWIDPEHAALVRPVAAALDSAAAACRTGDDCDTFKARSFELTLDVDLDRRVKRVLDAADLSPDLAASIVVMNARNGDVIGMASHDPLWEPADATFGRDPVNYAFEPLPVGSAAKAPVAAAILISRPPLRRLEVRNTAVRDTCKESASGERNYVKRLLGVTLGDADDCERAWISTTGGGGEWIDFTRFLQFSSNEYAAALSLLAVSHDANRQGDEFSGETWRLGTNSRSRLPPLPGDPIKRGVFDRLRNFPDWSETFDRTFAAGRTADPGARPRDSSVWRDVTSALPQEVRSDWPGLEQASPARLAFDYSRALGGRAYINLILGGQDFGWSSVKLGEAYARLVTGREVRARLASGPANVLAPTLLGYDGTLHAQMCTALSAVMTGGTGAAAKGPRGVIDAWRNYPAFGPDVRLELFGKTGTPVVERHPPHVVRQVRAENRLIGLGHIRPDIGGRVHFAGHPPPFNGVDGARLSRAVRGDARILAALGHADLGTIINNMIAYNAGSRATPPYRLDEDRGLRATYPELTITEDGHVLVFVVAAYRGGESGDCSRPPLSAYVVTINLQDPNSDALVIANRVLSELRGHVLRDLGSGAGS